MRIGISSELELDGRLCVVGRSWSSELEPGGHLCVVGRSW
jgi:hypothetical protein